MENWQIHKSRWGGIMRAIDQTDFETGNVEYIEFWMQDPFLAKSGTSTGGQLYFNLGNISEDVLRMEEDYLKMVCQHQIFQRLIDNTSVWGRVPSNPLQVTNAFSNDPADRPFQDIGFDGLNDADEKIKFHNLS